MTTSIINVKDPRDVREAQAALQRLIEALRPLLKPDTDLGRGGGHSEHCSVHLAYRRFSRSERSGIVVQPSWQPGLRKRTFPWPLDVEKIRAHIEKTDRQYEEIDRAKNAEWARRRATVANNAERREKLVALFKDPNLSIDVSGDNVTITLRWLNDAEAAQVAALLNPWQATRVKP